jgi:predicted Rossmann fold nucleotide-binding protein DprA/Smf involved in DNA uptake
MRRTGVTPGDAGMRLKSPKPDRSLPRVVDAMSAQSARTPERIARESGLSRADTSAVLGLLQMSGLVHERASGWILKK